MQVGIRELKAKLSEYIRRVQEGESIEITDHGMPVAHIVPLPRYSTGEDEGTILHEPTPPYAKTGATKTGAPRAVEPTKRSYASLVKEVQKAYGHKTARETETRALEEYLDRKRRLELIQLFGTVDYDPDYDYKAGRRER